MGADFQYILTWVGGVISGLGFEVFAIVAAVTIMGYLLGKH